MLNQTKQSHSNSMVLGSCKVELYPEGINMTGENGLKNWAFKGEPVDVGLLRGLTLTYASTAIEIKADNGTVALKGENDSRYTIAFNLIERHLPIISLLHKGLTGYKIIAGDPQVKQENFEASGMTANTPLTYNNADGSTPTAIKVELDGEDLLASDYSIIQINGGYALHLNDMSILEDGLELTITYSVTAVKSYQVSRGLGGIATPLAMKLTNKRKADDGRVITRTFEFPYVVFNGADTASFKNGADADSLLEVPVQYMAEPHPDMIEFTELSDSCLMKEMQEL